MRHSFESLRFPRLALALGTLALPLLHCSAAPDSELESSSSSVAAATTITPHLNRGMCLDVAWASKDNGGQIQLWPCNGGDQEAWVFDGGTIRVYGNKCLDVREGNTGNGAPLQIWDCNDGNPNQQWERNGNMLVWRGHDKCIDVPGGNTAETTRLQMWDCLNNANQQWAFGGGGGSAPAPTPPPAAPAPPPATPAPPAAPAGGWKLVWSDEFEGGSVDRGKWNYEVDCNGGGNNELQCYTDSATNSYVKDGHLVLKVVKQDYNGKPYTSARLNSTNKGDWTYGRFESRAKVPCGQGFWPAIWMLPTDWKFGGWPTSGEIDIMEILGGQANKLYGTIHFGPAWPNNQHVGGETTLGAGNFCDDYHVFATERYADHMTWFVDGREFYSIRSNGANWSPLKSWPFDERFHWVLNVAMGGNWPGNPDPNIQAGEMDIDYVRVYSK